MDNSREPTAAAAAFELPTLEHIHQEISLKLSCTNFLLWKTQIFPVLRCHDLLGFIDGSSTCPTSPPKQVTQWKRLDQMVLGWLLVSLSDSVLSQVVDKHTSRDVWLTLETLYGTQSRARIQQIKTELQSLSKGSMTVHDYIQRAKSLSLNLASAGKPIDDDDLTLWTLRGLGAEYDPIVAAINSRPISPTFADVCGLLLDYELRLTSSTSSKEQSAAFINVHSGDMNQSSSSSRGRSPSNNRGGRNNRGRGRGRGRNNATPDSSSVVCFRCGHPYHKANNCLAPDNAIESTSRAFNAMHIAQPSDPAWYIDTGATHNMAPSDQSVYDKQPYYGNDNVMIGDGSGLPISHTGHENRGVTPQGANH